MLPIGRRACLAVAVALLTALSSAGRQRSCAAAGWADTRVAGPFVCRADFPLAGCDGLLADLAQLQRDVVRHLGIPPARQPIELYLFNDKATYTRYIKRHFPNVPYRRALYVKREGPGMVFAYRSRQFEADVRHECTHALLHAVLPVVPLWLDEGLAEYFEVPARHRALDNPHLGNLRWNLGFGVVPRLESLEEKGNLSEMGQSEYRYSWAWVHFMLHGPSEAHDELVRFLGDIRSNVPSGVLSQRLQRRLPETQRRLAAHFKSWRR